MSRKTEQNVTTEENKAKPDKCTSLNSFINSETKSQTAVISVKGKLKPKLNNCKVTLNAPQYILDVIEFGYISLHGSTGKKYIEE